MCRFFFRFFLPESVESSYVERANCRLNHRAVGFRRAQPPEKGKGRPGELVPESWTRNCDVSTLVASDRLFTEVPRPVWDGGLLSCPFCETSFRAGCFQTLSLQKRNSACSGWHSK
jgi:hypothetical protein